MDLVEQYDSLMNKGLYKYARNLLRNNSKSIDTKYLDLNIKIVLTKFFTKEIAIKKMREERKLRIESNHYLKEKPSLILDKNTNKFSTYWSKKNFHNNN